MAFQKNKRMKAHVWHIQKHLRIYYLNEIKMAAGSQKSIHLLFVCQAQTRRRFLQCDPLYQGQETLYLENFENCIKACPLSPSLYHFFQRRCIQLKCIFSQGFANTRLLILMTDLCFLLSMPVASQCLFFIPLFTRKDAENLIFLLKST